MHNLILFIHVAAAIFWMGGMAFMLLALRPALAGLQPPQRLPVYAHVLTRFFVVVWLSIAALLGSGSWLFARNAAAAPPGWHVMAGLGAMMMLVFAHIYFAPWKRLKQAVRSEDWAEAGRRAGQITWLAKINLGLGWAAIAAVLLWR